VSLTALEPQAKGPLGKRTQNGVVGES
jgi:hypothetical protein